MRKLFVYTLIGAAALAAPALAQTPWPTYDLRTACTQMLKPRVLPGFADPGEPDPRVVATCIRTNEETKQALNNSYMWEHIFESAKQICAHPFGSPSTYDDYYHCIVVMNGAPDAH